MVCTRAIEAASSSVARRQPHRVPLQEAQDPVSELEVLTEDVEKDVTSSSEIDSKGLVREASTATDEEDEHLVYDWTRFRKDKIWRRFKLYYCKRRVIIERGVEVQSSTSAP